MGPFTAESLIAYVKDFTRARVLVVGDLMIDEFIYGSTNRISPEAPVPVVNVTSKKYLLGGAANVLNNIHALHGKGFLCGVVGNDEMGRKFTNQLKSLGANSGGIIKEPDRPTTIKTRIIADHRQQVVRYDQEVKQEPGPACRKKIVSYIKEMFRSVHVLIISDYAKGVLSNSLLNEILNTAKSNKITVCVDNPKLSNYALYKNHATVMTPNVKEASKVSGIEITTESDLLKAGRKMLTTLACDALLITRGEEGMTLFEKKKGGVIQIPTKAKEVYDVTGAGDTVIATLSMALAVGASFEEAAVIANHAAGIVVSKLGTATVTFQELIDNIKEEPF
jgi:D-beta-D-heptose 7-phosphate kinase/D-beta-D-heptose 1-phosphate adenosyltransferase